MVKKTLVSILFLFSIQSVFAQSDTIIDKLEANLDEDPIFLFAEIYSDFIGWINALHLFISNNIVYPEQAEINKIQGKSYIYFEIDKSGNVTNTKVIKSSHELLDKEALRVISILPKWKPASHNGKFVRVKRIIPINFTLP